MLAQGVVNNIEPLVLAEGVGSGRGFEAVVVEVGARRGRIWIGARGIWIGVVVVCRLRISIVYRVHVHVHGAGHVVEVDRVGFKFCLNFLHKLGIEVEGIAGPQVHGT